MDDLTNKVNELLSDPQAMQQLNSLAVLLGLGNSTPDIPTPPEQNAPAGSNPLRGLDLSSLVGLLGNAGSAASDGGNIPQSPGTPGGPDTAKLSSLLSSLGGAGGLNALLDLLGGGGDGGGGLGALAGLLGGNEGDGGLGALSGLLGGGGGGGLSDGTLQVVSKISPLLSTFRQEDNNTQLLHALYPLLGPERQKKVDEAIKMLSMLRLLPVLREQGILQRKGDFVVATNGTNDMQRVQQDTIRRVREMQNRVQQSLTCSRQAAPIEPQKPEPEPQPQRHCDSSPAHGAPSALPLLQPSMLSNLFDGLLQDGERTLILVLLLILVSEKANTGLIFTLMYLII